MIDDQWPPDGAASGRPMWEALDEELHREVEDGGERMPMLRFTFTLAGPSRSCPHDELATAPHVHRHWHGHA